MSIVFRLITYPVIYCRLRPLIDCFGPGGYEQFTSHTVLDRGYDFTPDLDDPSNRAHLIEQQREADALYETQFKVCKKTMGDILKYSGTATVTRDIDFMATALEGKESLMLVHLMSFPLLQC